MFSFRYLTKILVGDQLQQRCFGSFHMVIQEPERQRSYIALVGVMLGGSRFGSSRLKDGVHQEDLGTQFSLFLDPFVKIRQCGMLKFTTHTHTCLNFMFRFFGFGLPDLDFYEQKVSIQVYIVVCILDMFYIHVCFISQTNLFLYAYS